MVHFSRRYKRYVLRAAIELDTNDDSVLKRGQEQCMGVFGVVLCYPWYTFAVHAVAMKLLFLFLVCRVIFLLFVVLGVGTQ